jgi:NADH-quinone oxidoreductase subunit H
VWFLIKVGVFVFFASWVRATLPRLRLDQILAFAWKFLFPLSLINFLVLATEAIAWPDPTNSELVMMVGINWTVAIVAYLMMSRLVSLGAPMRPLRVARLQPDVPVAAAGGEVA